MHPGNVHASAVTEDLNRGTRLWGEARAPSSRILVISPDAAQRRVLNRICAASNWAASDVGNWRDAVFALSRFRFDVILCDDLLPDGGWKDVLSVVAPMPESPRVIVMCDNASAAQWSEVLNLGAFDLLNRPLDDAGVTQTVAAALRSLHDEAQELRRRSPQPLPARSASA
jgi:DNA-binding NtrC family response regulator